MEIVRTLSQLRRATAKFSGLALIPTMGALHRGHLGLIAAAQRDGRPTAASVFVNPLQFGPNEDFARYPRDEDGDFAQLEQAGCDLVWAPDVTTMYPPDAATTLQMQGPALLWEGTGRPGHFAGVATVVAKLLGQVRPDAAYFGEKDWQQIQVVSRMTTDLLLPVQIIPVPTIREPDGLALSSRNRFLSPAERATAPQLYDTLTSAAAKLRAGAAIPETLHTATQTLTQSGFTPHYLALVHAHTLDPIQTLTPPARLIAAAQLGTVRLLDNIPVG